MPNIGPLELVVVLIVALVILGPKRLPAASRSAGRGIREFKDALTGGTGAGVASPRGRAEDVAAATPPRRERPAPGA
jgi:sec-independent protein translocase protein TatA